MLNVVFSLVTGSLSDPVTRGKILTTQLRALEEEGFVTRTVYAVVPPKVEYALTDRGRRAIGMIEQIRQYGKELMEVFGVSDPFLFISLLGKMLYEN